MVEYQLLVAGGFIEMWEPLGGVDVTRDIDLLEPDPWTDPFFYLPVTNSACVG